MKRPRRESPEAEVLGHAISYLGALADQGQETITVRKAMELLGVTWQEPQTETSALPPGADPLTGCKPVTAQSGPEKVQAAVRAARGGPAPVPPQGFA